MHNSCSRDWFRDGLRDTHCRHSKSMCRYGIFLCHGSKGPAVMLSAPLCLSNVDDQGEEVYGAETWFRDSFVGTVYPATSIAGFSGHTEVSIEKPCNAKAADGAMPGSSGGGSGGGDGNPVGGGSNPLEGCGTDVVTGCTTVEGITNCQTNTFIICGTG